MLYLFKNRKTLTDDFRVWGEKYALEKNREERFSWRDSGKLHPSVKNYLTTLHLLLDYEYDSGRKFSIRDVDEDFLADLIQYSFEKRNDSPFHKYYTKGGLSNKTVNKRIDALFFFMESTYPKKLVISRPKHLDTLRKRVVRLSIDELHQLESLEIKNPILDRTRDYFLFLCYTGLRYGDFIKLDRTYFEPATGELVLTTNKTSRGCRIYLNPCALAIAEKYDFRFRPGCNQDFNRYIKLLLEKYHLFETVEVDEYMSRTRVTRTALKRELISCHTGRRTYISLLAENGLSAYEIMSATGHTQVDTVMYYIDLFGSKRKEKFVALNRLFVK